MSEAKSVLLRIVSANEGSPYPKCSLWLRGGARAIDLLAATGVYFGTGRAGSVMALLYLLLADSVFHGQSIGKKIFGIRAVYLPTRSPVRSRDSVLRNAPFGLIVLLGMMPEGLGKVAFFAGALVIGGIEAWQVYRHALGTRLGDVWAETQVVDGKVLSGSAVETVAPAGQQAPGRVMYGGGNRVENRADVQPASDRR